MATKKETAEAKAADTAGQSTDSVKEAGLPSLSDRLGFARADLDALTAEVAAYDKKDVEGHTLISAELAYLTAYVEKLAGRVEATK